MADQGRWFKLWCSALTDDDLANLDIADFGRWAKLGTHVKEHGTDGSLRLPTPCRHLCELLQVADYDALIACINRLPNVTISSPSHVTNATVTFSNWHKYQRDSSAERMARKRSRDAIKKRGEEKRRDEKKVPPKPPACVDCETVLKPLREITGRNFLGSNGSGLHARHQEHGVVLCVKVVEVVARRLLASENPKIRVFARPKTLFGPENFLNYMAEAQEAVERSAGPAPSRANRLLTPEERGW